MVSFKSKQLDNAKTLGEKLRGAREEENITLTQASNQTQIPIKYLEAMENKTYEIFPGQVYIINYLKKYANFLRLNEALVLKLYYQEKSVFSQLRPEPIKSSFKEILILHPRFLKLTLIVLAIVAVLGYLGFEAKKIITPPALEIGMPADNLVTQKKTIEVAGQTEKEAKVKINGQDIFLDQNGEFRETIDLQPGLNIIRITAKKKRSGETVVLRKIMMEEILEENI